MVDVHVHPEPYEIQGSNLYGTAVRQLREYLDGLSNRLQ